MAKRRSITEILKEKVPIGEHCGICPYKKDIKGISMCSVMDDEIENDEKFCGFNDPRTVDPESN